MKALAIAPIPPLVQVGSTIASFLRRLGAPLALICALAFAVAPLADGVICGMEDRSGGEATVSLTGADADHGPGGSSDTAGHCTHGHCHHGSAALRQDGSEKATTPLLVADLHPAATSAPPSAFLANVERPPRV